MDNSKFDILYIKEQLSIKKHIVITGPIGSGKSTLLKELRFRIVTIGIFNPESLSVRNRMKPVTEGFNTRGVSWLNESYQNYSIKKE